MIGQTLLHFKITAKLGEGGMGEVYRAEDTKLGREVAIKVMPAVFTEDPERLARFEREAKVLAALNHPNIAGIYEVGHDGGTHFIAMEMAEGEDLATRLGRGALPLEEALGITLQIATALEAAHAKGIVHRDLKPANVMVTPDGQIKVLDFGLAKAWESNTEDSPGMSLSPTLTAQMTQQGVLLGTAAYMSPEQARGESADGRSDVWALGIVLMEMLTGQTVYRGKTVSDSLAGILAREPDWDALPGNTPPPIRHLLARCLEKEAGERLQAVGEARIAINRYLADPDDAAAVEAVAEAPAPSRARTPVLAAAAVALAASGFLIGKVFGPGSPERPDPVRLEVLLEAPQPLFALQGSSLAFSPGGRHLTYVSGAGGAEGRRLIHLRSLDQYQSEVISGTEGGYNPIFSPDGNWIAFITPTELKKVSISGGAPLKLCNVNRSRGATWGEENTIVFAPTPNSGLSQVSAAGGEPVELTQLEDAETSHRWPQFLPGGKILYVAFTSTDWNQGVIKVFDPESGTTTVVHRGGTYPRYTASGHLLYWRQATLFAAPFDLDTLEMTALPAPVVQNVRGTGEGGAIYDLSPDGTLGYLTGEMQARIEPQAELTWGDGDGFEPASQHTGAFSDSRLSPDDRQIVTTRFADGNTDLWLLDLERDTLTRLTFADGPDLAPAFTPDGRTVYFSSLRGSSQLQIYRKPADGSSEAEMVLQSERPSVVLDISRDGEHLLYLEVVPETQNDLRLLHLPSGEARDFVATSFNEGGAVFSPDGQWVAYQSDESGAFEIYVRPFPGPGGKWQVSSDRGRWPRWSADGRSLYYRSEESLMRVSVQAEGTGLRIGTPEEVSTLSRDLSNGGWDLASDGRFLLIRGPEESESEHGPNLARITFNWLDELERMLAGQ